MENTYETNATCRHKVMKKIKLSLPEIIGTAAGAVTGFLYYNIIGCPTGQCPITSNPWLRAIVGALIGCSIGYLLNKNKK